MRPGGAALDGLLPQDGRLAHIDLSSNEMPWRANECGGTQVAAGGPQQTSMAVRRRNTSSDIFAWWSVRKTATDIRVSMPEGEWSSAQKELIGGINDRVGARLPRAD